MVLFKILLNNIVKGNIISFVGRIGWFEYFD